MIKIGKTVICHTGLKNVFRTRRVGIWQVTDGEAPPVACMVTYLVESEARVCKRPIERETAWLLLLLLWILLWWSWSWRAPLSPNALLWPCKSKDDDFDNGVRFTLFSSDKLWNCTGCCVTVCTRLERRWWQRDYDDVDHFTIAEKEKNSIMIVSDFEAAKHGLEISTTNMSWI